jgi:hypothetical protein
VVCDKIEALAPLVIRGVPKEKDEWSEAQICGSSGGGVGIAGTTRNVKVRIGRCSAERVKKGVG